MKKGCIGCLGFIGLLVLAALGLLFYLGPDYDIYLFPPSPQTYAKSVIRKMDFGLYTGSDWEEKKAAALEQVKAAKTYQDTYPILKELTEQAGGKHSYFYTPEENTEFESEGQTQPEARNEEGILYLKVPAFSGNAKAAGSYQENLNQALQKEDYQAVIVDLRDNTGGNMNPMLAGLSSLLPTDELFQFEYKNGTKSPVTKSDILQQSGIGQTEQKKKDLPVAVLINSQTGSSGEMTALAFKGLPQVKFFGRPTAGYTTGNNFYNLYDGAALQLTTSRVIDRTGKVYENEAIQPDIVTDQALEEAKQWLKEQQ